MQLQDPTSRQTKKMIWQNVFSVCKLKSKISYGLLISQAGRRDE